MIKTVRIGLLILLAGCFSALNAQSLQRESRKPISAGFLLGVQKNTLGFGMEIGYLKGPASRQFLYGLDLHTLRHPQETRIESFYQSQGRRYVLGKLNHFLVLNPSLGVQTNIVPRSFVNLVNLQLGAKLGPAIGLLNPYYLEIFEPSPGNPVSGERVIRAYDPDLHSYGLIVGRANLISSQISPKIQLGLSLKTYALLDFARDDRHISAIKLSMHVDAFTNQVPIMITTEQIQQKRFYLALGVGLVFGTRW